MWAMTPGSSAYPAARGCRSSGCRGAVPPLLEVDAILLQTFFNRLANGHLEQRLQQALDADGGRFGTERHQRRVGADRSKSLIEAQALVDARNDFRGKASVGIAMLHELIGLQHA